MSKPESAPARAFNLSDRLHLCVPAYGCQVGAFSAMALVHANDQCQGTFDTPEGPRPASIIGHLDLFGNESHIDRARNRLVDRFLRGPFSRLMFLDADIEFSPEHLGRLWLLSLQHPRAILAASYATKSVVPHFALNRLPDESPDPRTGLVKVRHTGTGFMIIPRALFDAMREDGQAPEYLLSDGVNPTTQTQRAYFKSGVHTYPDGKTVWLSEDYDFCERARALGFDILVDRGIELRHHGTTSFPLPVAEVFEAARRYRAINHPDCPPEKV